MVFDHVGIVNRNGEEAGLFYEDLLGLEVIRESLVSPELSRQLFSVDQEIKMILYGTDDLKVEAFILPDFVAPVPGVPHFCILVPDLPGLLEKAKTAGVKVIAAKRGDRTIYFIEDFSGNRIEIKQKTR